MAEQDAILYNKKMKIYCIYCMELCEIIGINYGLPPNDCDTQITYYKLIKVNGELFSKSRSNPLLAWVVAASEGLKILTPEELKTAKILYG